MKKGKQKKEGRRVRRPLDVAEARRPRRVPLEELLAPARTLAHADGGYSKAAKKYRLAMDAAPARISRYCEMVGDVDAGAQTFIGYPACSLLAQDGLMQAGVCTLADEMVRTWPAYASAEAADADAAARLNAAADALDVRGMFRSMAEYCGFFGGGMIWMDLGKSRDDLAKPISLTPAFIAAGSLRRLVPVEPYNCAPLAYEAVDPLDKWYFRPRLWYVTGVGPVHASHFLRFVPSEPPILLRPSYNFFGVPQVQVALDYLRHFTGTRESAARLLRKFSLTVLKTDMDAVLYGSDDSGVRARLQHLADHRDNDGIYAISNEDEEIVQLNTPLTGVTEIVRQALELLACVWRIPVVKFLGISPGGFNATGESDIRSFYDHVESQRAKIFGHNFDRLSRVLCLSVLGHEAPGISWEWPSLWTMTRRERAEIAKIEADTAVQYFNIGALAPDEIRTALAGEDGSRYAGIAPEDLPETDFSGSGDLVAQGVPDGGAA